GHINFSHGELFMLGGFFAFALHVSMGLPYLPSLILAVAGAFLLGIITDLTVYRPLLKAPPLTMVMATVGLSFVLKGIGRYFWGGQGEVVPFPPLVSPAPVKIGGIAVFPQQLVVIASVLVCMIAITLFFKRTRAGKIMQATAESSHAASL